MKPLKSTSVTRNQLMVDTISPIRILSPMEFQNIRFHLPFVISRDFSKDSLEKSSVSTALYIAKVERTPRYMLKYIPSTTDIPMLMIHIFTYTEFIFHTEFPCTAAIRISRSHTIKNNAGMSIV